jgi:hypothetical protein
MPEHWSRLERTTAFTDGAVLRLSESPPFELLCICYIYNNLTTSSSGK